MRVLMLGGTRFLGRRVVERLHDRGDQVLVVHRGHSEPGEWIPVDHLRTERHRLAEHTPAVRAFDPDAVVDSWALTEADVDAVTGVLPRVPTVVLSSQDVYQAFTDFQRRHHESGGSSIPLDERAELRRERYPYRGAGVPGIPDDYDKLDVEQRWLERGAVALRLPMMYGPHDGQRREDPLLRRVRSGRTSIPIGLGDLRWTRAHVDDLADAVLAALDTRDADGQAVNLGESHPVPVRDWFAQILRAAGAPDVGLVRVPDQVLPADLAISAAAARQLEFAVERADALLGWKAGDPLHRVTDSVRWHMAHPPPAPTWTPDDTAADDQALNAAD